MSLEAAFLEAIIEAPDDDLPRLVYADWLDENGQPERADFIRVQIELAKLAKGAPGWAERKQREQELWEAHWAVWLAPFRHHGYPLRFKAEFRRGFLESLSLTGDAARPYSRSLFLSAPLREVHLLRMKGPAALEELLSLPGAGQLLRLQAPYHSSGDGCAEVIAGAAHLTQLTELGLTGNEIGDEGARRLAGAAHLRRLSKLILRDNRIGDDGLVALASSSVFERLEGLYLSRNAFGPLGIGTLIRSPHLAHLRELSVHENGFDDDSARLLARSPLLEKLTLLDLGQTDLTDAGLAVLVSSPRARNLAHLWLTGLDITEAGARALLRSPNLKRLQSLELTPDELDEDAQDALRDRFGEQLSFCWPDELP